MEYTLHIVRLTQHSRFRGENRADIHVRALAHKTAQAFLNRIVDDAIAVFVGAHPANLRRHTPADEAIHNHVGVFAVNPDVDAMDAGNVTHFVADNQAGPAYDLVLHRVRLKRFDARHLVLEPVRCYGELGVVDLAILELLEQIVDVALQHPDVFVGDAVLALTLAFGIADGCEIKEDTFGGAAGRRQEFADQFGRFDNVAGFFFGFTNRRFFGRFVRADHSRHNFDDPAVLACRFVAAATQQSRQLELLDQNDGTGVAVKEQHTDCIAAFEIETPGIFAHALLWLFLRLVIRRGRLFLF